MIFEQLIECIVLLQDRVQLKQYSPYIVSLLDKAFILLSTFESEAYNAHIAPEIRRKLEVLDDIYEGYIE